ncbi:MAG: diguanylate cyclase [Lachnospiraceae bacterium]|nr:diguanylate cyclase [Lachnospiraceae bacterium]
MKKKIAVFANGWNSENLYHYMTGVTEALPENDADLFVFLSHGAYGMDDDFRGSEKLIYSLPDLTTFDGVLIFGAGLNFPDAINEICTYCDDAKIPVVSMGIRHPGYKYIGNNNYVGMKALCEHLITEHNVKKILWVAGSKENEDSQVREQAVRDTMAKYGLPFEDDDIYYSNWETPRTMEYVQKLYPDKSNLPGAILCANDQLAIAVSLGLEKNDIEVPDDLIITGFDFSAESQMFFPAISSVDQHFDLIGQKSVQLLYDLFEGKEVPDETILDCVFVPGESCGCSKCRNADVLRRTYTRHIPTRDRQNTLRESRFNFIEWTILGADYYSHLAGKMRELIYKSDGVEGSSFAMLVDPRFGTLALNEVNDLPKFDLCEIMDVIVAKHEGVPIDIDKFPTKNLFPGYTGEGQNHCYVFTPLYLSAFNFGYIVMCDNLSYFDDMFFRSMNDRIRRVFDSYRKNLKLNALNAQLSELMQKDALTSARNRIAFENYKANLIERFKLGDRTPFAVAMFDINNLKTINDKLGHESGDIYIKNSCKLICDVFKHSPVFRIGGDEFVAIVSNSDYSKRWDLLQSMRDHIEALAKSDFPDVNKVSIASGMAEYQENLDSSMEDVFRRADDMMYKNKYIMKNGEIR